MFFLCYFSHCFSFLSLMFFLYFSKIHPHPHLLPETYVIDTALSNSVNLVQQMAVRNLNDPATYSSALQIVLDQTIANTQAIQIQIYCTDDKIIYKDSYKLSYLRPEEIIGYSAGNRCYFSKFSLFFLP